MSAGSYGKYFFLRSHHNREMVAEVKGAMDKPGAAVVLEDARKDEDGNSHQLWFYERGSATIRNKMNGLCLDVKAEAIVVNPYRRGKSTQQFVCADDRIQSQEDFEMVVSLEGGCDVPCTPLVLVQQDGSLTQCWNFDYRPPEYFFIRSQDDSMVFDVEKGSSRPGADVVLYKDNGKMADNQMWYEDENSIICSKVNGFALDASGSNVCLNPYDHSNDDMQWVIHDNTIRNRLQTNLVLEIKMKKVDKIPGLGKFGRMLTGAFGDHPNIRKAEFMGNVHQLFSFDVLPPVGISLSHAGRGKYFMLRNRDNGMVLEVQGGQTDPGTPVVTSYKTFDSRDMKHQLFYEDDDTDTIRTAVNGYSLEIVGGVLVINPTERSNPNQKWQVYGKRIQNGENADHVIEVFPDTDEPGSNVTSGEYSAQNYQHWEIEYQPAKPFYILSQMHGKALDIYKQNSHAGASVIVWDKSSKRPANQLWYEDEKGIVRSKLNGYVLDSSDNNIEMQPYNPSNKHQQWKIVGEFVMNKAVEGFCIDISGASKKNGAKLCAWNQSGDDNQKWRLEYA